MLKQLNGAIVLPKIRETVNTEVVCRFIRNLTLYFPSIMAFTLKESDSDKDPRKLNDDSTSSELLKESSTFETNCVSDSRGLRL